MSELQNYGTGRRKTATARVFLRPGSGQIERQQPAVLWTPTSPTKS